MFKPIRVTCFKSSDGTQHNTEAKAILHEAKIETKKELEKILHVGIATGRTQAVVDAITMNPEEVATALKSLLRAVSNYNRSVTAKANMETKRQAA